MLSIEQIRRDPEGVRTAMASRGEPDQITELLELDARWRGDKTEADKIKNQRNQVNRDIGHARSTGGAPSPVVIEQMRTLGGQVDELDSTVQNLEGQIHEILLRLPNIPLPDVPLGGGEEDNKVIRQSGEPPKLDFEPQPHWDLGEQLGIIDFQRGAKLAGSRFYTTMGAAAKLERALIFWMLDLHTQEHGYTEVNLPAVVKREIMEGSGNLPKFADNLYHDDEADLWLIPTAEVPITNLYRDEIIPPNRLPMYYVAQTPCFRREKTAAGRDTRGIKRVHQFNKVEMYKFVEPETSGDELERLLADAEDVCRRLGFTYRVLQLCTGDIGFASAKTYDIEVWAAGCQEWLEVSSCSNCTDFQARRANIRYRPQDGARPQLPHTLNGSGLALPRVIIAIMENYQQADGSIVIPDILRPYTGFDTIPAV
jgi:seryl-tRNA synthetase